MSFSITTLRGFITKQVSDNQSPLTVYIDNINSINSSLDGSCAPIIEFTLSSNDPEANIYYTIDIDPNIEPDCIGSYGNLAPSNPYTVTIGTPRGNNTNTSYVDINGLTGFAPNYGTAGATGYTYIKAIACKGGVSSPIASYTEYTQCNGSASNPSISLISTGGSYHARNITISITNNEFCGQTFWELSGDLDAADVSVSSLTGTIGYYNNNTINITITNTGGPNRDHDITIQAISYKYPADLLGCPSSIITQVETIPWN